MIRVVNKYKHTPTGDDVFIGRGSKWGNPFRIGPDGDRSQVIEKYAHYIVAEGSALLADLGELKNKNLVCFCAPQACHGEILAVLCEEMNGLDNQSPVNTNEPKKSS